VVLTGRREFSEYVVYFNLAALPWVTADASNDGFRQIDAQLESNWDRGEFVAAPTRSRTYGRKHMAPARTTRT